MPTEKLTTLATGLTGAGAIEAVQQIDLSQVQQGAGLIVQILIGIVTLLGLFKKKSV